ncbi:MAG: hypothetical protein IID34_17090 [Planctomycetes bacterium]|nr:hypothetical protein [Planctomycetota bacterium]
MKTAFILNVMLAGLLVLRGALSIGDLTFRSTEATDELSSEAAACLKEIADMLFLQDSLRLVSASYAIVPFIDLTGPSADLGHLMDVQAFVAYCYASPRHEFGDIFLSSEHMSMAIFFPGLVPLSLVRPDFHVRAIEPGPDLHANDRGEVEGYAGLYNFRHSFCVAKGSRLYGPKPHLTLNHSQDLSIDLDRKSSARTDFELLRDLLSKKVDRTVSHIFTAVRWFNAANNAGNDDDAAIVDLSIAFETLLRLPEDNKTDRLTDAICLLLGRTPRLDVWARQFYDARSRIVHEGRTERVRFVVSSPKNAKDPPEYQSLLSYGRQVFQLCLGTVLVGAELAAKASLKETLFTNQERFTDICKLLSDETLETDARLARIAPIVAAIQQYQYVYETGLQLSTMFGAVCLAATCFLEHHQGMPLELKEGLAELSTAKRTEDHLPQFVALRKLNNMFGKKPASTKMHGYSSIRDMVNVVWNCVFMHFYWAEQRDSDKSAGRLPDQGV